MSQTVRLYEGEHFKLTPEQVEAIRPALDEIEAFGHLPENQRMAMIAQVWECEDGVFCCCRAIPSARALIIKQVLNANDITAISVESALAPQPTQEVKPGKFALPREPQYECVGLYVPDQSDFKVGDKVEDGIHYRRVWPQPTQEVKP